MSDSRQLSHSKILTQKEYTRAQNHTFCLTAWHTWTWTQIFSESQHWDRMRTQRRPQALSDRDAYRWRQEVPDCSHERLFKLKSQVRQHHWLYPPRLQSPFTSHVPGTCMCHLRLFGTGVQFWSLVALSHPIPRVAGPDRWKHPWTKCLFWSLFSLQSVCPIH